MAVHRAHFTGRLGHSLCIFICISFDSNRKENIQIETCGFYLLCVLDTCRTMKIVVVKHIPKFWYSLCVCFIWHILCEMWQQFLLFILVFISPYFITTWRQFLQQVMSKLHWFAEKNKISCKTNFLVDFIFPEILLNLWYGEWCWRVRNSILDVKQTDI